MKQFDIEDEKIGQENEEDLKEVNQEAFSQAVLWATDWTTETVISQLKKGNIELSPSFQRRDAWGSDRKSRFIESIILGLPIPQIILAERKDAKGSYIVIDGKQRLLSIRQFCVTDESDIFSPLKLNGLKIIDNLNAKTYNNINQDQESIKYISAFENQSIRTVIIRNWPNQNFLYTVFLRLNTGSLPLSPQELRQALNPGPFISYADDFSIESSQIRKALKIKKPDYRMRDVEIVVRFFSFKNFIEEYTGNLKEFLDKSCETLNKKWRFDKQSILEQSFDLDRSIEATFEIFGENAFNKFSDNEYTGVFNRPVFDIMTYYFSIPEVRSEAVNKKAEIKLLFEHICTVDSDFLKSLESSTKNLEPTSKRYSEWGHALKAVVNRNFLIPQRTKDGLRLQ
jgi:hypothetical protein